VQKPESGKMEHGGKELVERWERWLAIGAVIAAAAIAIWLSLAV
jgi:hypothetical protein